MSQITDYLTAQNLVAHYVCARCYGRLLMQDAKDGKRGVEVACTNPECNGNGFVTRSYAERRVNDSSLDYQEAYANLAELMGIKKPRRKSADILSDLGV